ncbi:GAG-pre-integrase domain containing protein [Nitzschia inconspicua]|uniref:GAG-pre-integrase domain containing protein n=1 Tax=Nitzschia inconspicua TaxID=303405 RepID=A0A9K3LWV5_9STRA|nr:GAG-pre-integrase domain containing protein [Nitzschia inconspicua]
MALAICTSPLTHSALRSGYLSVRTFYHPNIQATVIDERDLLRASGLRYHDYGPHLFSKDLDVGTWTYRCDHKLHHNQDLILSGPLIFDKAYTLPLIPVDARPTIQALQIHDPDFATSCARATIMNIFAHQESQYAQLRSDLEHMPEDFSLLPFHDYIHANTPIHSIKAATERMLWHQRLGHPSDHYLYNAHKYIDGVPNFKHHDPILERCPTCIKQKNERNLQALIPPKRQLELIRVATMAAPVFQKLLRLSGLSRFLHNTHLTAPTNMSTTGKLEDFAALRTFGCRVWVRPTTKRPGKYVVHSRKGIFLGYLPDTTKNIVWYDIETQVVKIAKHAQFDEGMNDLPIESIPPNVQYLLRSLDGQRFPSESSNTTLDSFTFTDQPFTWTIDKSFKIRCSHPTFGLTLTNDELFNRAYVQAIHRNSTIAKGFSTLKAANNKIRGAYITSINHHPAFTVEEAQSLLALARESSDRDLHISFAPERAPTAAQLRKALAEHDLYHPDHPDDDHTPVFRLEDIRHIAALRHPEYDFSPEALASEHVHLHINAISSHTITRRIMLLAPSLVES